VSAGKIAAFFDVDHTLLDVNSGRLWVRHLRRTGQMPLGRLLRAIVWLVRYRLAILDLEAVTAEATRDWAGVRVAAIEAEVRAWFEAELIPHICPEGQRRIERHRAAGHVVALLTSGTRFSAEPLAARLGVEHVLCTRLEERDGVFTGSHLPPACGGPGKIVHAQRLAAELGLDLSQSYFYTDSLSDLPMLTRVGKPCAVNPDPRLRRHAQARGWPIETWRAG
jgi:HAD superfamily hydrolase (TIGR01490 family)